MLLIHLPRSLTRLRQFNLPVNIHSARLIHHLSKSSPCLQRCLDCHNDHHYKDRCHFHHLPRIFDQQRRHASSFGEKLIIFSQSIGQSFPVQKCTGTLIWIHDYTGLPWYLSIIGSTILFRTLIVFPFMIYDRRITHKLINIAPELNDYVQQVAEHLKNMVDTGQLERKKFRIHLLRAYKKKSTEVYIKNNVHPGKKAVLICFQLPLWITMSQSLSNLCIRPYFLPDPAIQQQLLDGGALWFQNLIQPDPYYVLPMVFCLSIFSSFKVTELLKKHNQSDQFITTKFEKFLMAFLRIWTVFLVGVSFNMPSGIVLYWATSALSGTIHHLILSYPSVRRTLKIPPIKGDPKPLDWDSFVNLWKKNKF